MAVAISRSIAHEEYRKVDARLSAELSEAVRVLDVLARQARARAIRVAADPDVQQAFAEGDVRRLRRIAADTPAVGFEADGARIAGARIGPLVVPASVVADGRELGRVVVAVPVPAVAAETPLAPGDRLVAGEAGPEGSSPETVTINGARYRGVSTAGGATRLSVLAPTGPIAATIGERRRRVVWAVLASVASIALLALLLARAAAATNPRRGRVSARARRRSSSATCSPPVTTSTPSCL